jgi:hypothetical protein
MAVREPAVRRAFRARLTATALLLAVPAAVRAGESKDAPTYAVLEGAEAEAFLRAARVVARKPIGAGVTRSERLTLTDGERTARAAWKTLHQHTIGLARMQDGRVEFDFRDSWKHDVAAYELDKLLGLGLVPPTVERRIDGRQGSLQLWIEGAMTDLDRRRQGLQPPDPAVWASRRAAIRFLRELAYDTDYNVQNTLVAQGFRVWAIDFSRAFRVVPQLPSPETLGHVPRATVERLRALDGATVQAHLGAWLDGVQIDGLLKRRERLLAQVDQRQAGRTETVTVVP